MAVIDHVATEPQFIAVHNAPAGYQASLADVSLGKRCPVMQHCKQSSVPLVWNQSTYVRARRTELWEQQAAFGYRNGLIWAMHMPNGRHFVVGVRDQALPNDPDEVTRMVAALQLFTTYAQEVAMPLLASLSTESDLPKLTERELETLRWTMEGKTAWEVGRVLGIAENTVIRHGHSASKKLDCTGKLQAAVKALRLGLIR